MKMYQIYVQKFLSHLSWWSSDRVQSQLSEGHMFKFHHISMSLFLKLCLTLTLPLPPAASNCIKLNDDLCLPFCLLILLCSDSKNLGRLYLFLYNGHPKHNCVFLCKYVDQFPHRKREIAGKLCRW